MSASYQLRLILQCVNTAFLVHLMLTVAVRLVSPWAVRFAESLRPNIGTHFLLALRLLPALVALYVSLALVLPSYLRLEDNHAYERIGIASIALTCATVVACIQALVRSAIAVSKSAMLVRHLRQRATPSRVATEHVLISQDSMPRVAVAGLVRPRVVVSQSVLPLFSPRQLELVLHHEKAHQISRDNAKRLLWLLFPDALPFVSLTRPLEYAYKQLVEWAADDFAVAGSSQKSADLASALVTFARFCTRTSSCALLTSFIDDSTALKQRIERLLTPETHSPAIGHRHILLCCACGFAACFALLQSTSLFDVHELLELLSR